MIDQEEPEFTINDKTGKIVETKKGIGRTKNSDPMPNGKLLVYLESGEKIICSPDNIKLLGFYD